MASQAPTKILLKGGTLLTHNDDGHVSPTVSDLLIEDSTITKIDAVITAPSSDTKVIDCTNKIISPGFINTHAHLWQTARKGAHPNHSFVEYMPTGNYTSSFYTLEDAFWGELAGALENIDGGTTSVVDHSHLNLGVDYRLLPLTLTGLIDGLSHTHSKDNHPGSDSQRPAHNLLLLPTAGGGFMEALPVERHPGARDNGRL